MDMTTSIPVYGAPEFQLARMAVREMGRYYNLPTWGYAGHSNADLFAEQASADAVSNVGGRLGAHIRKCAVQSLVLRGTLRNRCICISTGLERSYVTPQVSGASTHGAPKSGSKRSLTVRPR
jgi:hypothetical protein